MDDSIGSDGTESSDVDNTKDQKLSSSSDKQPPSGEFSPPFETAESLQNKDFSISDEEDVFKDTTDVTQSNDDDDATKWLADVKHALKDGCDFATLRAVSQNRLYPDELRPRAWQILLGVANKRDPFQGWDELFNLPFQDQIRVECANTAGKLGNSASEGLGIQSDLESVLTLYGKNREMEFESENGWMDILQLLLALHVPKSQIYNMFYVVTTKYIPRGYKSDGRACDLFRLLLLYHEPQLCSFLDTKKVKPDMYAETWLNSLFAHSCDLLVTLRMWDVYLQQADPFFIFFLSLVVLVNAKEQIFEMSAESCVDIASKISNFPSQLEQDDIEDFCQLATYYSSKTPQSFRRDYHGPLFGCNLAEAFENVHVHSLLSLPVSIPELLQSNLRMNDEVHYLVVDARPTEQYNSGHLPGAFNLDATLLVNDPSEYMLAMQTFCAFKQKTHPTEHICFMGSGREEEDQYVNMLLSSFLQHGTAYVSYARGGYLALHETLKESLSTRLKSHSVRSCIVCNPPGEEPSLLETIGNIGEKVPSILNRVSFGVRNKAAELKGKVGNIVTATAGGSDASKDTDNDNIKHISSSERGGKIYRQADWVFSIDDDESEEPGAGAPTEAAPFEPPKEKVKISQWIKKPDIIAHFPCHEVNDKATAFPGHLFVTNSQLIIVRESEADDSWGYVRAKRPLSSVVKITSKRHYPELLTFKYGREITPGKPNIFDFDRLLIQKSGDAAKVVKNAIIALQTGTGGNPFQDTSTTNGLVSTSDPTLEMEDLLAFDPHDAKAIS